MDVINGRSAALAGAIAVAVLSGVSEPARADTYAFGNTESPSDYATLTLQEGSDPVSLSTDGFQGWVGNDSFNFAGPDGNTNYLVGVYNGTSYNNYFAFDIAGVKSTVTSAKLTLYSGCVSSNAKSCDSPAELDYSLYGATQLITQLSDGVSPNAALYNELGQGVKYGSFVIDSGNSAHTLILTLNATAVNGINAAILGKKTAIAISGAAIPIPEPSTWIMMLAGFAGLSLAACQRAARGRVASAAG